MTNIPDQISLTNRQDSSALSQSALNGASLSRTTLLIVLAGLIGSLSFTLTYLIEGATRPGYDARQQAISALSLGPGGQHLLLRNKDYSLM